MNKRFNFKFSKYMTLFMLANIILGVVFVVYLLIETYDRIYSDINTIDSDYLIANDIVKEPNQHIKDLAAEHNVSLYFTDTAGNILYPHTKKGQNLKSRILKNLRYAHAVSNKKGTYMVYFYPNQSTTRVNNARQIKTDQLLESIVTQDYNKWDYKLNQHHLSFIKNPNPKPILDDDELGKGFENSGKFYLTVLMIYVLLSIVLIVIATFFVTKRVTKPMSYYIHWINHLAHGKLYQPTTKSKLKRFINTYPELHHSLSDLTQQLLNDKFYHNQMTYYKSKWISQVSHDLKSPLTTIYGYAKLIHADSETQQYVNLITQKASFMTELLESLNQTFDIETNQIQYSKELFPVESTMNKVINVIGYDNIDVYFHTASHKTFYGNKLYFERLMINLINNSLEHNNENPHIQIQLKVYGTQLIIDYLDDGIGLPHTDFKSLVQETYTTKKDRESHGFGLSIINDAVNYHHGTIQLQPTAQGVHFHIMLQDKS
ncbi:two-component sensor histidine kinase [Staphylococcus sp. HMSC74F12]|uniref:HAMP domain-containing histidine kinase n=1 Tax=Staphylococcus sp. HMSC74F12 TaxID=1608905 RepID=UPI0008A940E2|nr:HAMP domain-containing histidine kinase [Staphylococcus sp. HMSC74F12]OHS71937.1 two-component sensor histidine kinase [Staphylococcus sp. HMSC74F12]